MSATEIRRDVVVASSVGLHARPAALFCKAAAAQPVPVTVAPAGGAAVDARSVLAVMGLGVRGGETVTLCAAGDGAAEVLDALAAVLSENHDAPAT